METVGDGPRVKFATRWSGPRHGHDRDAAQELASALDAMAALGCCPVLDDGLLAGNAGLALPSGTVLVSPSGRRAGRTDPDTLVEVVSFDASSWSCEHRGRDATTRPTSDTPLHWLALTGAPSQRPTVSLHGHLWSTDAEATALEVPISGAETVFSTPEDRAGFHAMLEAAPYPAHRVWIRRNHGFFVVGADARAALETLTDLAARAARCGLLPAPAHG